MLAVVQLQHGTSATFASATQLNLTNVQRGLVETVEAVRAGVSSTAVTAADALSAHVDGLDTFSGTDKLRRKHAEQEALLTAIRLDLEQPQRVTIVNGQATPAAAFPTAAVTASANAAVPASVANTTSTTPANGTKPRAASSRAGLPPQIRAEQGVILSALAERDAVDMSEILRVIFYDMGGQPEFWPLVGEFIRRCVLLSKEEESSSRYSPKRRKGTDSQGGRNTKVHVSNYVQAANNRVERPVEGVNLRREQ